MPRRRSMPPIAVMQWPSTSLACCCEFPTGELDALIAIHRSSKQAVVAARFMLPPECSSSKAHPNPCVLTHPLRFGLAKDHAKTENQLQRKKLWHLRVRDAGILASSPRDRIHGGRRFYPPGQASYKSRFPFFGPVAFEARKIKNSNTAVRRDAREFGRVLENERARKRK